ncbi:MAG: hypothetical protein LQ342_006591 [Letrouitia transgressa]|nr:MAG: hypothetical protein LQ342_006591 [Letrouitia transgressa]
MARDHPHPSNRPGCYQGYTRSGEARFFSDGKDIYEDKRRTGFHGTKGSYGPPLNSGRYGEGEGHGGRCPGGRNGYGGRGGPRRSAEEEEEEHAAIAAEIAQTEMLESSIAERLGFGEGQRSRSTHSYVRERPPGSRKKAEPYYASSDTESIYSTDTDELVDRVLQGCRNYERSMGRPLSGLSTSESDSSYTRDPPPRMARSGRRMGGYPDPYGHLYPANFDG